MCQLSCGQLLLNQLAIKTKLYLKNLANLNPRKHGFVPICAVSALELHALSRYPGNRQNDRMTDRNTNRLPYTFAAHAHRGITTPMRSTCHAIHSYEVNLPWGQLPWIQFAMKSTFPRTRLIRSTCRPHGGLATWESPHDTNQRMGTTRTAQPLQKSLF